MKMTFVIFVTFHQSALAGWGCNFKRVEHGPLIILRKDKAFKTHRCESETPSPQKTANHNNIN